MPKVPLYHEFMSPTVFVLNELGGSATNNELEELVPDHMDLSEAQMAVAHDPDKNNRSEVAYRMAWARTYLKKAGYLENSQRGVWSLSKKAKDLNSIDAKVVVETVQAMYKKSNPAPAKSKGKQKSNEDEQAIDPADIWRVELLQTLMAMTPDGFERLAQRLLRESGFIEVKVTGKSGDGGIDGTGVLRLQGLVSFQVFFQCKKWKDTVPSKEVRDFRGAMVGRGDKGLFITTGRFTREAQKEATRDGAPPVDLIDGNTLVDLLRERGLGLRTEMVEKITVDADWYESI